MKWAAGVKFGLYSSAVIIIFTLGLSTSSPMSFEKCQHIVMTDGNYNGSIQRPYNSCQTKPDVTSFNDTICVLSFNVSEKANTTYGIWLTKINNNYHLKITRNKTRPKAWIWFFSGTCNSSWQQQIKDWNVYSAKISSDKGCNSFRLDPTSICNYTGHTQCSSPTSYDDEIDLTDASQNCSKCESPLQKTESHIVISDATFNRNTTEMSIVMKSITSSILEQMENITTASVTIGDVQGVVVKPEDPDNLKPVSFIYSDVVNLSIIQDESQLATYPTAISVPKEAFEKAANQRNITLFTAVFRFPNFTKDEKNSTVLNNEVYSIDMGAEIANLTNTVNITFRNVNKSGLTLHCHSWNGEGLIPKWTTDGCNTAVAGDSVTCACIHLTFFAMLMAPDPTENISSTDLSNLTYITSIGCGLSIFFLGVALFMHFLLRRARKSDSVSVLINLFVALVLLNLTFLTNEYVANTGNLIGCKLMAGFMHYSLLTSFTWFGLEALHLCLQLSGKSGSIKHYLTKICIAGWAPPVIVVTVIFCLQKYNQLVIHTDTGNDVKMCWITDSAIHYVVNIGYYSIIFALTFTTFVIMLRWIFLLKGTRVKHDKSLTGSGKQHTVTGTSDALTVMGLSCTLGLTWGFAFFAYGALRLPSYYIFTILNSFQGFFLFIYYYKTSQFVGENMTSENTSHTATEATSVENPYEEPKPGNVRITG